MLRLLRWPLALTLFHRDGYEPAELYAALGWPQRLSRAAFFPITLPALLEKRSGDNPHSPPASKDPGLALHILQRTLKSLRARTRRAMPRSQPPSGRTTPPSLTHYTAEQSAAKLAFVRAALEELRPARVLDIGANTGEFSALAASLGASVIALERDAAAAERIYTLSRERNSTSSPCTPISPAPRPPSAGRTPSPPPCCRAWNNKPTWCCCSPSSTISCSWSRFRSPPSSRCCTASPAAICCWSGFPSPTPCSRACCAAATRSTARSRRATCSPPARPLPHPRREPLTNGRVLFLLEKTPA
jgi:hypothetical protein